MPVDLSSCVLDSLLSTTAGFSRRTPARALIGALHASCLPKEGDGLLPRTKTGLQKVQIANEPELAAAPGDVATPRAAGHGFDLGGGHADVSLVDVGGRTAKSFPTAGDLNLGGADFDMQGGY